MRGRCHILTSIAKCSRGLCHPCWLPGKGRMEYAIRRDHTLAERNKAHERDGKDGLHLAYICEVRRSKQTAAAFIVYLTEQSKEAQKWVAAASSLALVIKSTKASSLSLRWHSIAETRAVLRKAHEVSLVRASPDGEPSKLAAWGPILYQSLVSSNCKAHVNKLMQPGNLAVNALHCLMH